MMRLATICALAATPALASGVVDERAVTFCVAADPNFAKVEKCLPDAHVPVKGLDAVREIYGTSGNNPAIQP